MGNHGARAFLAGSLGFAVAFVVACGGGNGLLSSNQANTLNNQLSSVSAAVSAHKCGQAAAASQRFSNVVAGLPNDVNTTLIQNLGQGAATVSALAAHDCSSSSSSSSSSTSSSTSTTTSSPTTTTSSSTTTKQSQTTTATNPGGTGTTSNGGAGLTTPGGNNQNGQ